MNADRLLALYEQVGRGARRHSPPAPLRAGPRRAGEAGAQDGRAIEPASELAEADRGGEGAAGEGRGDQEAARVEPVDEIDVSPLPSSRGLDPPALARDQLGRGSWKRSWIEMKGRRSRPDAFGWHQEYGKPSGPLASLGAETSKVSVRPQARASCEEGDVVTRPITNGIYAERLRRHRWADPDRRDRSRPTGGIACVRSRRCFGPKADMPKLRGPVSSFGYACNSLRPGSQMTGTNGQTHHSANRDQYFTASLPPPTPRRAAADRGEGGGADGAAGPAGGGPHPREATRDRLTAASLARLTAPDADPADFPANARFALATLPALTTRPDQIKPLRQTILNLAVRGKLVEQDPTDEPASELLKRVAKCAKNGREGKETSNKARRIRDPEIRQNRTSRHSANLGADAFARLCPSVGHGSYGEEQVQDRRC